MASRPRRRAVLTASDGAGARPEKGRERAITPPPHFADAQAKQEQWQEFRDHGASLNRALNEALWWRVFKVSGCLLSLVTLPLSFLPSSRLP
jgi:hypothetical protein